jgi:hypothetical protein
MTIYSFYCERISDMDGLMRFEEVDIECFVVDVSLSHKYSWFEEIIPNIRR